MDQKQFNLFNQAIQWVADEHRRKVAGKRVRGLRHFQGDWGMGATTGERLEKYPTMQMVCATACCVAGNIVLAHGDQFVTSILDSTDQVTVESCVTTEGQVRSIDERAIALVGISDGEAEMLFSGGNSADEIVEVAKRIAAHHGYELEVI